MPLLDITPNPNYRKPFNTGQPYVDYYEVDGGHITPKKFKSYLVDIKETGYLKKNYSFPPTGCATRPKFTQRSGANLGLALMLCAVNLPDFISCGSPISYSRAQSFFLLCCFH